MEIEQAIYDGKSHGWIQWKGTDVCVDLHCSCGGSCHYDGDFLYYWRCPHCRKVWEMGTFMPAYEMSAERIAEHSRMIKEPEPSVFSEEI